MTIQNMHKETNQISISRSCSALGVSRSGYNKWIRQNQTHYSDPEEMKLKNEIQAIAIDFPRYGYTRKYISGNMNHLMKPTRISRNFWKWYIIKSGFIHL